MSFITAEGVSFSWGQARILQEVSLCAGKGKFVGVIGPNGSGKSTLLKCIYRVLHQDAGCIFLDGKENTKMGYKETARFLGVVAQHNIYDFDFSVRDIVLMGRSPHKKTMEQDNAEDRRGEDICGIVRRRAAAGDPCAGIGAADPGVDPGRADQPS